MEVYGVDISYCQRGLDYQKLKDDGIKFAIIRAGYTGTKHHAQRADDLLHTHVNGCRNNGIKVGFYFYSCARSVEEAKAEARFCADLIKDYPRPDYPVFIDVEESQISDLGRDKATDIVLAFIAETERLGYPSGVYCNPSWMEYYLRKSRIVGKSDIWLAHWVKKTAYNYGQTLWQNGLRYSAGMNIDSDICYIDYPETVEAWYKKHGIERNDVVTNHDEVIENVAAEVLNGLWGVGTERFERLTAAGYDYYEIQDKVTEELKKQSAGKIKIGSTVKVKKGAKTYDGKRLASFVYERPHTVSELVGDRAVIAYGNVVIAAVKVCDLIAV